MCKSCVTYLLTYYLLGLLLQSQNHHYWTATSIELMNPLLRRDTQIPDIVERLSHDSLKSVMTHSQDCLYTTFIGRLHGGCRTSCSTNAALER